MRCKVTSAKKSFDILTLLQKDQVNELIILIKNNILLNFMMHNING